MNGILVGERTFRATQAAIEYRPAEPVAAKKWAECAGRSAVFPQKVRVGTVITSPGCTG